MATLEPHYAEVPGAIRERHIARGSLSRILPLVLFLSGAIINSIAYWSLAPVVVFVIMALFILGTMRLVDSKGRHERVAVLLVFAICFFWAGVSASFVEIFGKASQDPDSTYFHDLVNDRDISPIEDAVEVRPEDESFSVWRVAYDVFAVSLLQNAGVILVWRVAYDFFGFLGLGDGRYIGITLNIAFVALTAAMGIKMVRAICGEDEWRIRRFTILFSVCGMFWLFGSLHIRDAMALFCVTFLALFWTKYLVAPRLGNLLNLVITTVVAFAFFGLVRTEFFFVPFAMILAGGAAKVFGTRSSMTRSVLPYVVLTGAIIGVASAAIMFPQVFDTIATLLTAREKVYSEVSAREGGSDSLGNQLILNQPGPLRAVLGTAYLMVSPIPFWGGMLSSTAYHVFKSLHVIFMYFALPMFALGVWRLAKFKSLRRPSLLFLAFSFIGFATSVGYTSLETRHIGAFLVLFLVLAVLPDPRVEPDRRMYKLFLASMLAFIVPLHLTWLFYRLGT